MANKQNKEGHTSAFALLCGRDCHFHFQANIDILEANKGSNKEEIRRLRAENKDVRLKLSHLVRGGAHGDEVELTTRGISYIQQ